MAEPCSHFDQMRNVPPRTPQGCEECLKTHGRWVHLRMCLVCGHVGCCDQSPGKHATAHFHETGHAMMKSFQRGEDWGWCFVDKVYFDPAPRPEGSDSPTPLRQPPLQRILAVLRSAARPGRGR